MHQSTPKPQEKLLPKPLRFPQCVSITEESTSSIYEPKINDYVIWQSDKGVEGWVYFKCKDYVTIETAVWKKDDENYAYCSLHRNDRVLVLCYRDSWSELNYVRSRSSVFDE